MIDILLATYNGEKYIKEQLDSIINQTYKKFQILVRDDGSKDRTLEIIKIYQNKYPQIIHLIIDDYECGSSKSNFMHLTKYATSDYVMYCDQDDFWLPNKIEITLKKMLEIENRIGKSKPILVFPSYQSVDENLIKLLLNEKGNQIAKYHLNLSSLIVQNYVTGCLCMVNKALYSMIGEIDKRILMHDWWMALIASSMGEICHIPDIVMLYRQHSNNVVGAIQVKSFKYRYNKILDKNTRNMKYKYRDQIQLFLDCYEEKLDKKNIKIINDFLEIFNMPSKIKRIRKLIEGRYLKSDFVRILGQLWYI